MLFGHVRDAQPHAASVPLRFLVGAAPSRPSSFEMRARIDKQGAQDCTGSYGLAVESWCDARGLICENVSRRFTYTLGRMIASADPTIPLSDDGAIPSAVIQGLRVFGVVPESVCPGDDANVINSRLAFAQLEAAWRVDQLTYLGGASGAERCDMIRTAIASSLPVPFGMDVDDAYINLPSSGIYVPGGNLRGAHAQRIVGYEPGRFKVAGSWGVGFGANGFAWISDEIIGGPSCYDFYALSWAPVVRSV